MNDEARELMSGETCFYERAAIRLEGNGLIRPGGLELTGRAIAISALSLGSRVLDIGCGTGATLSYLVEDCAFRAVGIDLSTVLLAEAHEKKPALLLARGSGEDLPFADAAMDAILAECSLSVMEDVEKVLNECSRVLKQQGLLLMHDVYLRNPRAGERLQKLPYRCCLNGAVSRQEWVERLEACRFTVAIWEDHSRALKEFAARLIFSHGSLEAFWSGRGNSKGGTGLAGNQIAGAIPARDWLVEFRRMGEAEPNSSELFEAISSLKPGYFLAVAKKTHAVSSRE